MELVTGLEATFAADLPDQDGVVTIALLAAAETVAMLLLEVMKPAGYWPATLLDTTTMVVLVVPLLWLLVFGPLLQLIATRRKEEIRFEKQARGMAALATENALLFQAEAACGRRRTPFTPRASRSPRPSTSSRSYDLLDQLGHLVPRPRQVIILETGRRLGYGPSSTPPAGVDSFDRRSTFPPGLE